MTILDLCNNSVAQLNDFIMRTLIGLWVVAILLFLYGFFKDNDMIFHASVGVIFALIIISIQAREDPNDRNGSTLIP